MPFFSSTTDRDEQLAQQLSEQISLLMRSDPQFAALVDAHTRRSGSPIGLFRLQDAGEIQQYLAAHGIQVPDGFGLRNMTMPGREALAWVTPPSSMPTAIRLGIGATGALAGAGLLGALGGGGAAGGGAIAAENVAPFAGLPGGIPASAGGAALGGMEAVGLAPFAGLPGAISEPAIGAGGASIVDRLVDLGKDQIPTGKDGWGDFLKDLGLIGGGNFLGALGDSLFQERNSFSGTDADPEQLLGGAMREIQDFGGTLKDRATATPEVTAYAQDVPGLSGRDPYRPPSGPSRRSVTPPSSQGGLQELQQAIALLGGRR